MKTYKQIAHELLSSVVHNSVQSGTDRIAKLTMPYYEIAKELGFQQQGDNLDVRISIKVEFITDEEPLSVGESPSLKNQTSN